MNDRGTQYEEMACAYLTQLGYHIIERNFSCRFGEIDIIARDGQTLVFVEVKYRKSAAYGHPFAQITPAKQNRLRMTANVYLSRFTQECDCRFDGIGILGESLTHLQNIF